MIKKIVLIAGLGFILSYSIFTSSYKKSIDEATEESILINKKNFYEAEITSETTGISFIGSSKCLGYINFIKTYNFKVEVDFCKHKELKAPIVAGDSVYKPKLSYLLTIYKTDGSSRTIAAFIAQ